MEERNIKKKERNNTRKESEKIYTGRTNYAMPTTSYLQISLLLLTTDELYTGIKSNTIQFIVYSGASDHLINREHLAKGFNGLKVAIKISVA